MRTTAADTKSKISLNTLLNSIGVKKNLNRLKEEINALQLERANYRGVFDEVGKDILRVLLEVDRATVTQIYIMARMEQAVASQRLKKMYLLGIVSREKEGKFVYYGLEKEYK